jgi:hypothetical protein
VLFAKEGAIMGIKQTPYGFGGRVTVGYDEAVKQTTAALKEQGFGVLTTIDVQKTLQEKLGAAFARTSFSAPATRRWRTERFKPTWASGCSYPATWWCTTTVMGPAPSKRWTRRQPSA